MNDLSNRFALALLREGVAIFDPAKEQPDILLEWLRDVGAFLNTEKFVSPGLDLVTRERFEQIGKHGRTLDFDKENNTRGQLKRAALYCLTLKSEHWPSDWPIETMFKIYKKGAKERYIIAAALLTAEVDVLCSNSDIEQKAVPATIDEQLTKEIKFDFLLPPEFGTLARIEQPEDNVFVIYVVPKDSTAKQIYDIHLKVLPSDPDEYDGAPDPTELAREYQDAQLDEGPL